jgi:uncharacterized protein (DUF1501 family)
MTGGGWDARQQLQRAHGEPSRYDRASRCGKCDLHARGLDKKVLVMAFGEFGRTPRINRDAGRDHWPGAMSVLLAGGGLKAGQMIGATDARGAFPASDPHSPGDVLATMYHVMGVDARHEFQDHNGRRSRFSAIPNRWRR